MAVKLRLTRQGRKKRPFYHIVAADERAPRDGRFIEKLGIYNPNTDPATIEVDLDKSVDWLQKGAIPTDTVKGILSYTGALYKNHLIKGAQKGAFPMEEVDVKFAAWIATKDEQIQGKKEALAAKSAGAAQDSFAREKKVKEARAAELLAKNSPLAVEVETEEVAVEAPEEVAAPASEIPVVTEEVAAVEEVAVTEEAAPVVEASTESTPDAATEVAEEAPAETPESPEASDKKAE